jgi:glycosyltransferase involved in cell wall biosynthesis
VTKILFLSQLLPYPPDSGPKVRSYYTLRYLAQKHSIHLLAFRREDDPAGAVEHLGKFCEQVETITIKRSQWHDLRALVFSLLQGKPFVIKRDEVDEMATRAVCALRNGAFEAVHADQLWMAQYLTRGFAKDQGLFKVLDEHNACFQIFKQLAFGERNVLKRLMLEREWRALKGYEAQKLGEFDRVVTVTKQDQATLIDLEANSADRPKANKYQVIPICVDTREAMPVEPSNSGMNVLHLGTMFWLPNIEGVTWFIREVWPLIKQRVIEASFTVVGKRPPPALRRIAKSDPSIQITGYVADPEPYMQESKVFIVPLLSGSGMRVKIVEAWSRGLAVAATSVGAEGLEYQDGENILIADGKEAFAQAVLKLLKDDALNLKLRKNGRLWCEERYDWREVYRRWSQIYHEV